MQEIKFHIYSVADILYRFGLIGGLLEDCQIDSFNHLCSLKPSENSLSLGSGKVHTKPAKKNTEI